MAKLEANETDIIQLATETFRNSFIKGDPLPQCICAPGRVNLIGEHTDYNEGYVLPMSLPLVTVIVGRRNDSNVCNLVTTSLDTSDESVKFEIPLNQSDDFKLTPGKPEWANYVKGVIANFAGQLYGFDAAIASSVPIGGGLSSSAALEVATYLFLESITDAKPEISLKEKAKACQEAENTFCNVPCGIMDQFTSFMGKKDHALLIDCRSLEATLVPMMNPDIAVLITNTNVRHALCDGEYAKRREDCKTAARLLGKHSLRDVKLPELEANSQNLGEKIFNRAYHVVSENERTVRAADALENEDYEEFGALMQQSHRSLRDLYEVSCKELDIVVDAALKVEGVYGSRMTGGGFGGCTVTLLKATAVENTIKNILLKYEGEPSFYVCKPGDGARIIDLQEQTQNIL